MITAGADNELFVWDTKKDKPVPCVGLVDGTKNKPLQVGKAKGYALQEDNVMLEYNIPPQRTTNGFISALRKGAVLARDHIKKINPDYEVRVLGETTFTKAQLRSKQAQTIGCEPDFNAYENGAIRLNPPDLGNKRSAGGHIHLGGDFNCPPFVVALFCDLEAYCWGYLNPSTKPRSWYRQPGLYREKEYGIEYRTLSNEWMLISPDLRKKCENPTGKQFTDISLSYNMTPDKILETQVDHRVDKLFTLRGAQSVYLAGGIMRMASQLEKLSATEILRKFNAVDWATFYKAITTVCEDNKEVKARKSEINKAVRYYLLEKLG